MRRKIEITPDGQSYTEAAQEGAEESYMQEDVVEATAETAAQGDSSSASEAGFVGAGVGGPEAALTALQAENEELRAQAADAEKRYLYAQAEFQNFIKRKEEESRKALKYANSEFIQNLFPVLDNFERALQAAEQTRNFDALIGGVNGTWKQLLSALQKAGVTPIEAVGQEFDPAYHDAIGHTESGDYPANTVAERITKGLPHGRPRSPPRPRQSFARLMQGVGSMGRE